MTSRYMAFYAKLPVYSGFRKRWTGITTRFWLTGWRKRTAYCIWWGKP